MVEADSIIKTTLEEIEKVLSTKTVVGEPITIEGNTLIPLISIGFGFGAGSMGGKGQKEKGEGSGSGSGGAARVKPVGIIVITKEGVRVEPVMGSMASALEKMSEVVPRSLERFMDKWWQRRKEKEG